MDDDYDGGGGGTADDDHDEYCGHHENQNLLFGNLHIFFLECSGQEIFICIVAVFVTHLQTLV